MKNKSVLLALVVMLLWGSLFPMVKLGFSAYHISTTGDILLFAGARFTICGSIICLYMFKKNKKTYESAKGSILPILLSGIFAITLHYGFTYFGLKFTDSSKTAIMKQVGVLFYICFSFLFFKGDRLTIKKLIGALIGFAGIIAINQSSTGIKFSLGDLIIIAASFCTVVSNVISKKALKSVEPIIMVGISQFFGGIILFLVGIVLGGNIFFSIEKIYIFLYICIASIFSYCIWFGILKTGELSKLFIIKFAEPLFACVFSSIILGENIFRLRYIIAFLLISFGIYISNSKFDKLSPLNDSRAGMLFFRDM